MIDFILWCMAVGAGAAIALAAFCAVCFLGLYLFVKATEV